MSTPVTAMTLEQRLGVVSPEQAVKFFKILVYGEPGIGKTWFAGTALDEPELCRVLYIDCEAGVITLRRRKELEVISLRTGTELRKIRALLHKDGGKTYKTVVIDTITELQRIDMEGIMESTPAVQAGRQDPDVPGKREYGKSGTQIRRFVRQFRDLPMHVIFVAHRKEKENESTELTTIMPNLTGQLARDVAGYIDVVGYMTAKSTKRGNNVEIKRAMQIVGTDTVIAKDRFDIGEYVIQEPTVPKMWDLIRNSA